MKRQIAVAVFLCVLSIGDGTLNQEKLDKDAPQRSSYKTDRKQYYEMTLKFLHELQEKLLPALAPISVQRITRRPKVEEHWR